MRCNHHLYCGVAKILWTIGFVYLVIIKTTSAVGEDNTVHLADLRGKWVLVSVSGRLMRNDPPVFFRLNGEVLSGYDGCNNFGGPLSTPGRIRTGGRGCAEGDRFLPLDLSRPAEHLAAATREGDRLVLPLSDGSQAVFVHSGD